MNGQMTFTLPLPTLLPPFSPSDFFFKVPLYSIYKYRSRIDSDLKIPYQRRMSRLPWFLLLVLLLVTCSDWTKGQFVISRDKPGACPPKSSVRYNPDDCDYGCNEDVDCPGIYKCCENECGSRCVPPVTQARSRSCESLLVLLHTPFRYLHSTLSNSIIHVSYSTTTSKVAL